MASVQSLALALSCGALTVTACAHRPPGMQPDPGEGYVLETTGAVVGMDDPRRNEPLEPVVLALAPRVAGHICEREVQCHGDPGRERECMHVYLDRAKREIGSWQCSPAASRARLKTCLAAIDVEPCALDRTRRRALCAANVACSDPVTSATGRRSRGSTATP